MKKVVSLLLALCMMCAMALPAMADAVELAPAAVTAEEPAVPAAEGTQDAAKQAAPAQVPAAPVDDGEPVDKYAGATRGTVEGRKGASYRGGALQFGFGSGITKVYLQQGALIYLPVVEPSADPNGFVTTGRVTSASISNVNPNGMQLAYDDDPDGLGVWLYAQNTAGVNTNVGTCRLTFNFAIGRTMSIDVEIVPAGGSMPGVNVAQGTLRVPTGGDLPFGSLFNSASDSSLYLLAWDQGNWDIDPNSSYNAFHLSNTNGHSSTSFGFAFASENTRMAYGAYVTLQMGPNEDQIRGFVTRLYEKCLGRTPDASGMATWVRVLSDGSWTAERVAWGFIFSREYTNRHVSDSEYVKMLYRVYMDREADPDGYNTWMNCLAGGWSREQVMEGFSRSVEFRNICARYGMTPW